MEATPSKLHFGLKMERQAEVWFLANSPQARLIARNFRSRIGEIDLIFEESLEVASRRHPAGADVELVFVEVRARLDGSWQSGLESVGPVKQRRLTRTIELFLSRYRGRARSVRIDILDWNGRDWAHIRDLRDLAGTPRT
jgi:Holliday junction resolvase-like predicted endonuclease